MKRLGKILDIVLDAILLLGALFNVINGSVNWNDYIILGGILLFLLVRIIRRLQNRVDK